MPLADAEAVILQAACEALLPDEELQLDTWSEDHVVIPKGSAFAGPYRLAHTPMARRLLQALSPGHPARRVVAKVASQMLKTQVALCAMLGWIDRAPANILALEPTDTLAKRLSNRFAKSAEVCDPVAKKLAAPRSRDKRNTIDVKEFDGGAVYITTAGADANLAEIPARYLFADEIDREGWRAKAGGEGNKLQMARARLTTYEGISKEYIVSSPTDLGASQIQDEYELGTQEQYHVPCPHCGHLHVLELENFHYEYDADADRVLDAWFVCPENGCIIREIDKATMLPDEEMGGQARWVATAAGDGETISVEGSAFYAPLGSITWLRIAKEHAQAKVALQRGDHGKMKVFMNTRMARVYDATDHSSSTRELMDRARAEQIPPRIVPDWALVVTLFADTQPNRLECTVEAWGPGLEHSVVDHIVLWGSPTDAPDTPGSVWQRLDELRRTPFAHASGTLIRISAYGIDSGGANTQDVYNYGSGREHLNCIVTKGHSLRNRPIVASKPSLMEIDWQGQKTPDGVKLWMLGTDTAKDHLHNRLRLASGPGAMHFNAALDEDFYEQLLVEKPLVRWHKGRQIREWIKPNGARNEVLDCTVGNLALAHYLGLHKWSAADWQRLRDNLVPRHATIDMFAAADAQAMPVQPPEPPPAHLQHRAAPPTPPPVAQPAPPVPAPTPAPIPQQPTGRRILSRGLAR